MKKQLKTLSKVVFSLTAILFFVSCSVTRPIAVTSNPVGNKCGEATTVQVFGIGLNGNNGINAAAKKGGISKISHVDYNVKQYLGIVTKQTTRVYGE